MLFHTQSTNSHLNFDTALSLLRSDAVKEDCHLILEKVALRSCGYSFPLNVQGQVGQVSEHPGLVEGVGNPVGTVGTPNLSMIQ